jgi:RNA ligase
MILDMDGLRRLNQARLVNLIRDPASGLIIADYSARAQFDEAWDAYPVLLDCRGTILTEDGAVVAKPFRKFFNLGERSGTQIDQVLGLGEPEITHKLDGSMATLFYSTPERAFRLATRGSFISSQAVHATDLWRARHDDAPVDPALTYVFEVLYPANRIVVDYGERDELVLIGLVETASGRELPYNAIESEARRLRLPHVVLEPATEWTTLHALDHQNFIEHVILAADSPPPITVLCTDLRRHCADA